VSEFFAVFSSDQFFSVLMHFFPLLAVKFVDRAAQIIARLCNFLGQRRLKVRGGGPECAELRAPDRTIDSIQSWRWMRLTTVAKMTTGQHFCRNRGWPALHCLTSVTAA
jgi:hypothetical protein